MHVVTLTPNSDAILTHHVKMKVKVGNLGMELRVGDRVISTVPLLTDTQLMVATAALRTGLLADGYNLIHR
jgi:hypothetical protein